MPGLLFQWHPCLPGQQPLLWDHYIVAVNLHAAFRHFQRFISNKTHSSPRWKKITQQEQTIKCTSAACLLLYLSIQPLSWLQETQGNQFHKCKYAHIRSMYSLDIQMPRSQPVFTKMTTRKGYQAFIWSKKKKTNKHHLDALGFSPRF